MVYAGNRSNFIDVDMHIVLHGDVTLYKLLVAVWGMSPRGRIFSSAVLARRDEISGREKKDIWHNTLKILF